MFRRRYDLAPKASDILPAGIVTATEGREVTLMPGSEESLEQRVRTQARYGVENPETGRMTDVCTELIWARTVTVKPEKIRIAEINELMDALCHPLRKTVLHPDTQLSHYIIEYPRQRLEDPIMGSVIALDGSAVRYDFIEEDDEIRVTGAGRVEPRDRLTLPVGTRMTASVAMIEKKDDGAGNLGIEGIDFDTVTNVEEPTPEQLFVGRMRDVMREYQDSLQA